MFEHMCTQSKYRSRILLCILRSAFLLCSFFVSAGIRTEPPEHVSHCNPDLTVFGITSRPSTVAMQMRDFVRSILELYTCNGSRSAAELAQPPMHRIATQVPNAKAGRIAAVFYRTLMWRFLVRPPCFAKKHFYTTLGDLYAC